METPDPRILDWAADERYVVLTNDKSTMIGFAYQRLADEIPMAGLVALSRKLSIGAAIEELLLLVEGLREDEWDRHVYFLPL